jgi:radical SAM protein with 4Fe4S-binding SPASM domain
MTHLDRLTARAQARRIPLSALFELTGRCNLDCGHCYLDIAHPPPEMSTAEACHVVDELARAGTLFLTLTGGELFLRKDALEIARHARRRGLALRLFTNATRVTRELAEEIARIKPLAVEVSLYGTHGAAHEAVTQRKRTLRRTLRGVLHLRRAGVNVGLKAPLLATVVEEMDVLFRLADRIGAPMSFDPFVHARLDGNAAPTVLRSQTELLARAMGHPRLAAATELPAPPEPDSAPCAIATRTTRITPTGDVYPCPTYPTPVGNVLERPFAELWSGGELLDRLRAIRWRDLHGDCAGCGQAGYCGRCSAVALLEHGDELGPARESCRVADARELARGDAPRSGRRAEPVRLHVIG